MVINEWQQPWQQGKPGYLPGLFNHSWLFVARHLLMMCYYKRECHILVLTLHIFNSFAIKFQKTAD